MSQVFVRHAVTDPPSSGRSAACCHRLVWLLAWGLFSSAWWAQAAPITDVAKLLALDEDELRKGHPVELKGRVMLKVQRRELLFVDVAGRSICVIGSDLMQRVKTGEMVRVEGISTTRRKSHVRAHRITRLTDPAVIPKARQITLEKFRKDRPFYSLVEVRGHVWGRRERDDKTFIELRDGKHTLEVTLEHGGSVRKPNALLYSTAVIRGICLPAAKSDSAPIKLLTEGWKHVRIVERENRSPYSQTSLSVAEALKVPPAKLKYHPVRVRGIVKELRPDRGAVIDDDTGSIEVVPRGKLTGESGGVIDVLGYTEIAPDGKTIRLEKCRSRAVHLPFRLLNDEQARREWNRYQPAISEIWDVRTLKDEQLKQQPIVKLQGNIVHIDAEQKIFILQDDTGGLAVTDYEAGFKIGMGMHVRVEGYADIGRLSPRILRAKVTKLPLNQVAKPLKPSNVELTRGNHDGQLVELSTGVIRSFQERDGGHLLIVARGSVRHRLRVTGGDPEQLAQLVNARVKVTGISRALFDEQGHVAGSEIEV